MSLSCDSRYNANRSAVFLPTPGSRVSSSTARSSNFEGYCSLIIIVRWLVCVRAKSSLQMLPFEMVEIAGESSGFAARYHFLGNERLFLGNVRLFLGQEMVFLRLVVNLLGL